MSRARDLVREGALGEVYAVNLVFHNAYGPDKPWFYDARLSGGGCVMDLGIHLVDLALWALGFPEVEVLASRLAAFYDFEMERLGGTALERLAGPPDAWGGRAAVAFAERLAAGGRFDPEVDGVVHVSRALDAIHSAARPDG